MNIHEYQAKEILKKFGLPILNGKSYEKNLDLLEAELNDLKVEAKDTVDTNPEAYEAQYLVIIVASDENEQQDLFEELTGRGHECRILN